MKNKKNIIFVVLSLLVTLFLSTQLTFALELASPFFLENNADPNDVEYANAVGEPTSNSGINFFNQRGIDANYIDSSLKAYVTTARVGGINPGDNFKVYGYVWNSNFGWISLRCENGKNRGLACDGDYGVVMSLSINAVGDVIGTFIGKAYNSNVGSINFGWEGDNQDSKRVIINMSTGSISGYAWNSAVGWMYFRGQLSELPIITGFECGNNNIDSGEECDDGNNDSGDGCSSICKDEVCGNGEVQPNGMDGIAGTADDEECDDGNLTDGDECSSTCKDEIPGIICGNNSQEVGETCDPPGSITPSGVTCTDECIDNICGDGFTFDSEECDDNNLADGDGCSSTCSIEIASLCGNGNVELLGSNTDPNVTFDDEECDDGNLADGDGCSSTCKDEVCGDYIIQPNGMDGIAGTDDDEECDRGDANDDGGACSESCKKPEEYCGDYIIQPNGMDGTAGTADDEECDLGDANYDGGVCSKSCKEGKYSICGDGYKTGIEDCDDGNTLSGDSCPATCQFDDDNNACFPIGDCIDVVDYVDARYPDSLHNADVLCIESCGNGYLDMSEECDDGNNNSGDGCSSSCIDETVGTICGNGVYEIGETCDDGNNDSGDGCNSSCELESSYICLDPATVSCEEQFEIFQQITGIELNIPSICSTPVVGFCGDGSQGQGEECDYVQAGLDFCTYSCEYVEDGVCGDGEHDLGEQCDDGNFIDGDGCDSLCDSEGVVSGTCGDGNLEDGEECDDGNNDSGDVCSSTCDYRFGKTCGNGIQETGEECDGGVNCSSTCNLNIPVDQLTCFPEVEVVHRFENNTYGDIYDVMVQFNCDEQPEPADNWKVENVTFDSINTIDCDQTTGENNDINCTSENSLTPSLNENDPVKVATIWSSAPTGYSCLNDDDNSYMLTGLDLEINDGGNVLFSDYIDISANLEFLPKLESTLLRSDGNDYIAATYGQDVTFLSNLTRNSMISGNYDAEYTLSVQSGDGAYKFLFDTAVDSDGNYNTITYDEDGNVTSFTGPVNGIGSNNTLIFATTGDVDGDFPMAQVIGEGGENGEPEGEQLSLELGYQYASDIVKYCAASLPDADKLVVINYGINISGLVDTDKFEGEIAQQIGSVGEQFKRRDVAKNISKLVKEIDVTPSGLINFNFHTSSLEGGDYRDYDFNGQKLTYFKDDVVLNTSGDMINTEKRSIVIEGGNLYIDTNLVSEDDSSFIDIVVFKDRDGKGGNIYIAPDVTIVNANIMADGSLLPYDGLSKNGNIPNWETLAQNGSLDNQFVFKGSIVANNTIGGSEDLNGNGYFYKGDGTLTTDEMFARIYDFKYFRQHGLKPGQVDSAGNPMDCDGDGSLEIASSDYYFVTCSNGGSFTSDLIPLGEQYFELSEGKNTPVYFMYEPPSKESLLFN